MKESAFKKLPKPRVFFPFLAYDWRADVATFYSFLDMLVSSHCEFATQAFFQDGVARSRNVAAHHFLEKTDCEFIFWVGLDVKFTPDDIDRILEHMVTRNLDIVGGLYSGKGPTLKWICTVFEKGDKPDPKSGLLNAKHVGSEFLCVRRSVYETIRKNHPELEYTWNPSPDVNEKHWNFHAMPIFEGELESEDWNICRVARQNGFKCYVDTKTLVWHRGNIYFPLHATLSEQQIAEIVFHRFRFDLLGAIKAQQAAQVPQLPALT